MEIKKLDGELVLECNQIYFLGSDDSGREWNKKPVEEVIGAQFKEILDGPVAVSIILTKK